MSVVAHTDNITNTITSLGRLLEISMNKVNDYLPLDEELTNIKSYIQIQKIANTQVVLKSTIALMRKYYPSIL